MTDVTQYADDHNYRLIMCLDSNAHSGLFGPSSNNRRGDAFEDFILSHGLLVHNQGTIPTFETIRGDRSLSSFIDITISLNVEFLWDWNVSRDFNGSDHNSIHFRIPSDPVTYRELRPWKKADWIRFRQKLDKPFEPPDVMSKRKLDRMVQHLAPVSYTHLTLPTIYSV